MLKQNKDNSFVVRPKKKHDKGSKRYSLHKALKQTLSNGNLRRAVKVPLGEDLNEWLTVNTIDFYNQLNLFVGSLSDICTPTSCEIMSAGSTYKYLWQDGEEYKKPTELDAPTYMNLMMGWVGDQLEDPTIFPIDNTFPKNFMSIVSAIYKRMFRIFAHSYCYHLVTITQIRAHNEFNTMFKHFYFFITEFSLVKQNELAPLNDLIQSLESNMPPIEEEK